MAESNCPLPTQDIKTNLANRQKAIDVAQYGPANPKEPNEAYWTEKAKTFGGSVEEAKTMRCGNCAGFNKTKKLMDCISKGIGTDAQEVEQAGDLGYCEIFDFKCASMRTCSAWIVGGPITDNANLELQKYTKPKLRERIKNRILRGTSGGKAGQWSARKAQLLVQAYEKAGGGYKGGRSKSQASLKKWGKEKWTTSDGKPSLRKGKDKRYLPQRVWDKLTPAQKAGANRTKAEGSKKGKQFVPNTPTVKKAFSYNGKTFELSDSATLLYDPSQKRDESGKWTSEGFVSSVESPKEISNRIISRIQKENPDIDIEDGKFKKSIESLGENLKDAKIKTKYGNFTPKQISNWIKSEDGQKLIGAVDKTLKVTGAGAIGALKGLDEAKFDIATNAIFAPQVIPFIATRSAIQGIFNNAVREYRSIKKGQEIKSAVERQVGVKPLEATMKSVELQEEMNVSDVAEYLTDVLRVSILKYIKNKKDFQVVTFAYDPNQERDASGKWTGSGGGGEILVSPNIKENMNYEEAKKMTDSPEHARAVSIARDAIKKQDMDGKVESGVGDWEDGAENSIKIDVKGVKDFDQLKYTASKLGASLNQKAVVAFQKKKDGPDILHKISADRPMDEVRKILSDNGISFRTMVGDRAKTSVTILDQGSQLTANVAKFLGAINGKSEAVRGVGEFIGGDTRIAGKKAYKSIIDNYERSFPNRVRLGVQRGGGRNYYRSYQAVDFYDPSQKRDDSGKWTGGGGSIAKGSTPTPRWAQDNPAEASRRTGEATTLYHGTSADVLKDIRKDGLKPSSSGVWGGGKVYSTDSLDLAMEYGVLRSGKSPKVGGKQLIGIISVLAEGFKSVADNIPTTKAQKMGKTGLAAVSKIFTKDGVVPPSAIKMMQIFEVDSIRKYVYENGPKPSPLATKELADGSKLIYVPIVIQLPDDGSEGFQFDEAVAIESFVFQYNGEKIEFYDPSQARDEKGRWAGGGSSGGLLDRVNGKIFGWLQEHIGIYEGEKHQYLKEQSEWAKSMAEKNVDPEKVGRIIDTIQNYTGEGYSSLNFAHRKTGDTERVQQETQTLDEAIEVAPKTSSDVLYRGMTQRFEFEEKGVNKVIPKRSGTEELAKNAKVGDVFEDKGFISTSEQKQVGENFSGLGGLLDKSGTVEGTIAKYTGKPVQKIAFKDGEEIKSRDIRSRVFMEIVGTKGKGAKVPSFATNMGEEKEVLLPRNSKFKILDVQRMTVIPDFGSPKGVEKGYLAKIKVQML
jgi:hypothetical protein